MDEEETLEEEQVRIVEEHKVRLWRDLNSLVWPCN